MKTRPSMLALLFCLTVTLRAEDPQKDTLIVETLVRLNRYDLSAVKPETRQAVLRHVETHAGTSRYVELLGIFNIRDHNETLLRLAVEKPGEPVGIQAAGLLLKFDDLPRIKSTVVGEDQASAVGAVTAFAATQDPRIVDILLFTVQSTDRPAAVRSAAVRGLGMSLIGEKKLLVLAASGHLPEDMKFTAANVLLVSRDEIIRTEAAKHLQLPASNSKPLPPVAELVKRKGDAARGQEVYTKATCIACHKVGEAGIDFGPALTEIGDKLGKDALYAAILDPSAGISFGFEGWVVTRKDGAQLLGYIAGETADVLTLRIMGGVAIPVHKADISVKQRQPQSLMTPNLQQLMNEQELVDLVEYLTTLKKAK